MKKLAALHEPDMIAGGWAKPDPTGLGDKRINSAIGGSWGHRGRLETIERAAEKALQRGEGMDMMNVELTICPPDKKGK
ncbi:polymorphic toxin type 15 domain-containing protein [Pseudomonas sp. SMSB3]|uniref:polymorphic toxin type 15 domain-containing protein n=1 Tax=Pseudomonas sp. SMSB3 TaxID=3390196 RepID=UPI003F849E84